LSCDNVTGPHTYRIQLIKTLYVLSWTHQTIHFRLCTALISRALALISNCKCIARRAVHHAPVWHKSGTAICYRLKFSCQIIYFVDTARVVYSAGFIASCLYEVNKQYQLLVIKLSLINDCNLGSVGNNVGIAGTK
jgi:hypothetical protein